MSGKRRFKKIALDSNLFIYQFEGHPRFSKSTSEIFQKLEQGKLAAATSIISLIEALSYPSPKKVLEGIREGFYTVPNLTIFEVNQEIGEIAAEIRRKNKIRLPDSIQLATAKVAKSQVFITNDRKLKKFKELPVRLLTEF